MAEASVDEDLLSRVDDKIAYGEKLVEMLKDLETVDGVPKLQRKIRQEISFLKKLKSSQRVKEEQLSCSNLRHLGALVECALRPGVAAVCKTFHYGDSGKIIIDIVSDGGRTWTKVVARNPRSLSALSHGNASYGARSVLDQAEDYLECASVHPCLYQPPQVVFEFMSGIEDVLAGKLEEAGVTVRGARVPTYGDFRSEHSWSDTDSEDEAAVDSEQEQMGTEFTCTPAQLEVNTLNLDVTAMMAYVSNMTNGHCHFVFKQPILTQQAAWEAKRPVKPVIEALFEGKNLVCCDTAWEDFEKIVTTLGGEREKERTEKLRRRITVMPDNTGGEDDTGRATLKVRGRVRLRSKIVFNFGHRIKALTVSANEGFVRAAHQQGLSYAAFIHESRALTENKELTATPVQS